MVISYNRPTPSGSEDAGAAAGVGLAGSEGRDGRGLVRALGPGDIDPVKEILPGLLIGGRLALGSATVGSAGSVLVTPDSGSTDSECGSGTGSDGVFHGFSRNIEGILGRAFVVDHGLAALGPIVYGAPGPRGDDGRRSCCGSSPHTPISSRLFSSPPGVASVFPAFNESPFKSLAASCTTDRAADAFDEKRPHIERTPLLEKRSVTCAPPSEREGRGGCAAGEGVRGGRVDLRAWMGEDIAGSNPRILSCLVR